MRVNYAKALLLMYGRAAFVRLSARNIGKGNQLEAAGFENAPGEAGKPC